MRKAPKNRRGNGVTSMKAGETGKLGKGRLEMEGRKGKAGKGKQNRGRQVRNGGTGKAGKKGQETEGRQGMWKRESGEGRSETIISKGRR